MRIGIDHRVESPFVVSFATVGYDDQRPPAFTASMADLRDSFLRMRSRHLATGLLAWNNLAFIRFTTSGARQSWNSMSDADFAEDRWLESLEGVPGLYDSLALEVTQWGGIRWYSPRVNRHEAHPIRQLIAELRSDDALVAGDADEFREALRRSAMSTAC